MVRTPLLISAKISFAGLPSTVHPMDTQVPNISLTVPSKVLAMDFGLMVEATFLTSSRDKFPLCWIPFLLVCGSFKALIRRVEADGTTSTWACLFWIISFTVTRRPL